MRDEGNEICKARRNGASRDLNLDIAAIKSK